MGSYLRERKTAGEGFFSKLKKAFPRVSVEKEEPTPEPEEVPKEHVEMVLRGERVPQPEPEEAEAEAIPQKKRPFWRRWFFIVEETYEEPKDDVDLSVLEKKPANKGRVDDDVKEMLRICVRWVNMLPPERIQDIKRSDEYVEFRRLLDKYGLIKK